MAPTIQHIAARLAESHRLLAREWLERLDALLSVDRGAVFPSHQLLDHIPDLIVEIAAYVDAPAAQEIAANTGVMAKASELGILRFDQRSTVHQLLREYQILGEILDEFVAREARALGARADAGDAVVALARVVQAVRVLQQQTVDAFVTKYTETIERQTAQLRSFSRLVSHEIRQPLGVLQVLSRVMPIKDGDDESSRLVQTMERNVVRLGEVAGKLERLARLTRRADAAAGDHRVDLGAVARDVALQLQEMADARGVRFAIADDLPTVSGEAGRVELVLVNLLANAVKYSDPDKTERLVHVESIAGPAGPRIRVRDNGLGIPRSKREVIFDQFVRVHAHLDDELGAQGMGLGLSIVRESMEAMGGSVTVESVEGEGTTFALEWPLLTRHEKANT